MNTPDKLKGQENLDPHNEDQSANSRHSVNRPYYNSSTNKAKSEIEKRRSLDGEDGEPPGFRGPWAGCGADGIIAYDGPVEQMFDGEDREEGVCRH